jgi:1-deoxy-D-xylulose-5-phosphate reductoisomerase
MGPVVTINSATLMNKGLELIEAHLFFGVPYDDIEVVVHPQSLVHSMVEFVDGSTIAQVSPPDMRLPIALALGWPDRVAEAQPPMDWSSRQSLTFEPLDSEAFPAVELARTAGLLGGSAPAVFNAANEEAVGAFITGRLPFVRIVDLVSQVVGEHTVVAQPGLDDVFAAQRWAAERARVLVEKDAA